MRVHLAILALGGLLALSAPPAAAQVGGQAGLQLPEGAIARSERETALGTYALPLGAYSKAGIPQRLLEGHILRRTWQLQADVTVLQVVDVLRRQLVDQGYELLFQCDSRQCGGFDFRFGIEVVPTPDMVVSLSDYHFLAAQKPSGADSAPDAVGAISLLVSRSGATNYIQLIQVSPADQPPLILSGDETAETESPPLSAPEGTDEAAPSALAERLKDKGHAVLGSVVFGTGAETLGPEAIASLESLAIFLKEQPKAQVMIVGHTDSAGTLDKNKALSLRRAQVVREVLLQNYDVEEGRVSVDGAGFMAPIASNLTAEGREKNRRVEVVLLSM
jgi:OOP family OmpA-OmpF porin